MGKAELRLEIDQALLDEARALKIDVEALTVKSLRSVLDRKRVELASDSEKARQWAVENAEAIALHRDRIERHGVFGEDVRTW
jgi:antitoxin CcdA